MLLYLELKIFIRSSHSLKDKRQVVHSIKDRLKSRYNLSVSELNSDNKWQTATLGIAYVGQDGKDMERMKRNIEENIYLNGNAEILSVKEEIL
ncbi:DUF503 domain-containing protein [candidate division WOR-3 bacterium]|uniref:DUF503 domain-containing protein n=1 Tax=candidate division TA06 bacterium TaxID=2250710 RepID=A0A660S746_UNCT6|nr:DUF503 domain-containing protein [candidate division WOR-3 bacterium]RKX65776.1 MAG: DUF503 domain-containing protein [candidate division TA06 bacterium]HHD82977.1 DUF503 domain-containing protein [Bacteroidota bacterium]